MYGDCKSNVFMNNKNFVTTSTIIYTFLYLHEQDYIFISLKFEHTIRWESTIIFLLVSIMVILIEVRNISPFFVHISKDCAFFL